MSLNIKNNLLIFSYSIFLSFFFLPGWRKSNKLAFHIKNLHQNDCRNLHFSASTIFVIPYCRQHSSSMTSIVVLLRCQDFATQSVAVFFWHAKALGLLAAATVNIALCQSSNPTPFHALPSALVGQQPSKLCKCCHGCQQCAPLAQCEATASEHLFSRVRGIISKKKYQLATSKADCIIFLTDNTVSIRVPRQYD